MNTEISGIQRIRFRTESLCSVCLKRIPAFRVSDGPDVYLEKRCKDHGAFRTVIWRGSPSFASWVRPKFPVCPPVCYTDVARGCPLDCGLCASHRQITCTALIEITRRCNLRCRYCFADAGAFEAPDPDRTAQAAVQILMNIPEFRVAVDAGMLTLAPVRCICCSSIPTMQKRRLKRSIIS